MRWIVYLFAMLYALAVALFAISAFGLFGQDPDPLGGIFLVPLGFPWTMLADNFGIATVAVLLLAPLINLALLYGIWRFTTKARRRN